MLSYVLIDQELHENLCFGNDVILSCLAAPNG